MPLLFLSLPSPDPAHSTQVREFPGGLVIHWHDQSLTYSPRVMRFTHGVTAQYGSTTVDSDELEIHQDEKESYALARGHVALRDPLGSLDGDALRFAWTSQTGSADNVRIVADSVQASVAHIDIQPNKWTLLDVRATGYTNHFPFLKLKSPRIEVVPGDTAVVRKPKIGFLGTFFGPFPDTHNNLTPGATGIRYPVPSFRQDHGFGISWASTIVAGKQSMFTGSYGNYTRTVPTYGFTLATTLVKGRDSSGALPPRYDLGDRFDASYFQNVIVTDPASDYQFLGYKRSTFAVSSVLNSTATGRDDFGHYSKPVDAVYEQSGMAGETALYGQIRAQQMSKVGDVSTNRVVGWLSTSPKPIRFTSQLQGFATGEGMAFSDTGFHWGRIQSGMTYKPVSFLRFSGAGFWGEEWGNARFLADKLDRMSGYVTRADLLAGPTQISYLMKFDPRGGGQYDREYSMTQAIGFLEAYINYRKYPSQFRYGVQLRLDTLLQGLSQHPSVALSNSKTP